MWHGHYAVAGSCFSIQFSYFWNGFAHFSNECAHFPHVYAYFPNKFIHYRNEFLYLSDNFPHFLHEFSHLFFIPNTDIACPLLSLIHRHTLTYIHFIQMDCYHKNTIHLSTKFLVEKGSNYTQIYYPKSWRQRSDIQSE